MRNPDRIPNILAKLRVAWEKNPDMRLIQLLVNIGVPEDRSMWFMEDDQLETVIDHWNKEN